MGKYVFIILMKKNWIEKNKKKMKKKLNEILKMKWKGMWLCWIVEKKKCKIKKICVKGIMIKEKFVISKMWNVRVEEEEKKL